MVNTRFVCVALVVVCLLPSAFASELTVDKRSLTADDSLTITLTLDGPLASVDVPSIPVQNLVIDGEPSVSTEFAWINGRTSRRRVLRYVAHPRNAGVASVGPLTLRDSAGVAVTFPAIPISVGADLTIGSNDPATLMRELIATGRDPIFIVAQADKSNVFEREEIVVSWTLYTAETIRQYSLGQIPKLADFWTEELDVHAEEPQQIVLGGVAVQKMIIRRAALFPLRSGTLIIGPMAVHASVMKPVSSGDPFGIFEGVMSDVHRQSEPIAANAKAIPPGPPVIGVAPLMNLTCGRPSQRSGGPVVFDVTLSGRANLRAVQAPAMQSRLDGNLQVVDRGINVYPVDRDAWMTRRWRYLIFPAQAGALQIPPLFTTFMTPAGERRELRCEAKTLEVSAATSEGTAPAPVRRLRSSRALTPVVIVIAAVVVILMVIPRARRTMRLRADAQRLVRATPAETRAAVEEALVARGLEPTALIREASDRGDAFRAFRSLIDAAEHDRITATPREIAHRIRDLLVVLQSTDARHAAPPPAPLHGG